MMSIRWVRHALTGALLLTAGILFLNELYPFAGSSRPAQESAAAPLPAPTFSVVQAAKPIRRGSVVGAQDVRIQQSPTAPAVGTLSSIQAATDRVALRDIGASEMLSQTNTAATPEGTSLSQVIPQGLRAVSLSVSDSSVANLIRPGDRVDVLVVSNSRMPPAPGRVFPPAEAMTILENIPVLSVGAATVAGGGTKSNGPARMVTLAVTPRQAAMVGLIHAVGVEYLSLRPADDSTEMLTASVSTNDLLPNEPAPQRHAVAAAPALASPAQPRPRTRAIEIIAGKSDNVSRVNLAERQ